MFINIMDSTVVNVALPTLSRSFGVPIGSVSGVVTAYLVTLAVAMPASGWIGDRFGGRNVLLAAITVFTAASAVRPRDLAAGTRGVSAPACRRRTLIPVGMTMITRAFPPPGGTGQPGALPVVPTLLLPALGPVIGGALVDQLAARRWIFFVRPPGRDGRDARRTLFLPAGSEHPVEAASTCPVSCS